MKYVLAHAQARQRAIEAIRSAPDGHVVLIKPPTRSLEQNAALWARLNEIAEQVEWHGRKLDPESWKCMFTASLKRQDVVPGLDGGFVVIGTRTSTMTKREMSDLLELIGAFAAERGIVFQCE